MGQELSSNSSIENNVLEALDQVKAPVKPRGTYYVSSNLMQTIRKTTVSNDL